MRSLPSRGVVGAWAAILLLATLLFWAVSPASWPPSAPLSGAPEGLRTVRVDAADGSLGPLLVTIVGAERAAVAVVGGPHIFLDDTLTEGWLVVDDGVHAPAAVAVGGLPFESSLHLEPASPFSVRVVDETRQPLIAAEIRAKDEPWASFLPVLRTQADGSATFLRLPREVVRLRLAAAGHLARVLDTTSFGADAVVLEGLVDKTFDVTDEHGQPVQSASVWLGHEDGVDADPGALTGPGRVTLSLPKKTPIPVQIRTETACSLPGLLLRGDLQTPPVIALRSGWFQKVVVRRGDKTPVRAVVQYGDPDDLLWRPTAMTDDRGEVTLGPLCSASLTVSADAGGASAAHLVYRDAQTELVLTMEPPAALHLIVRDDQGKPAANVQVAVTVVDDLGATRAATGSDLVPTHGPVFKAQGELGVTKGPVATLAQLERDGFSQGAVGHPTTNADGELRLTRLPPGRVTVGIHRPGYVPTTLGPVDLVPGRELVLRGRVERASHLEGRVLDAQGFPQRGYVVRLTDGGDRTTEFVTTAEGNFSFNEARDAVVLAVRKPGAGGDLASMALVLEPGTHTEQDLIIEGDVHTEYRIRALDSRGYPIEGAAIGLRPPGGLVRLAEAQTGHDGIAVLQFPVGGTLEITVRAQGFSSAAVLLDRDTPEAVVTLDAAEERSLRVVDDRRNAALAGAIVWVRAVLGESSVTVIRATDRAGIVHVSAAAGAALEYVVVAPEHGVQQGALRPAERDGTVRLDGAMTFDGRVVGADGPIGGATISGEGLGRVETTLGASKSQKDGSFRFSVGSAAMRFLEVCARDYRCRRIGPLRGDEQRAADLGDISLERSRSSAQGDLAVQVRASASGLRVDSVFPGSKLAESTLRLGDTIVTVDGRAAETALLEGPIGSAVVAEIERDGRKFRVALARERVLR